MNRTTFLLGFLLMAVSLGQVVFAQDDPLVAWWQLDEGSGTIAADSSGNGLDGTIVDATWVAPGYDDTGFCLKMEQGNYVDLGNPDALNFADGDWSVTAWINNTIVGTDEAIRGTIFANGGDNGGGIRYTLCVGETQDGCVTLTCDDDSTKVQATTTTLVNDGEWHHVVGMRQGTAIRVGVDGVLEGENSVAATYNLAGTSQHNAYIGVMTSHTDSSLFKRYHGLIDDVRVFRRALAENNLQDLYKERTLDFHKAGNGSPADGATAVAVPLLQWTAGEGAMFHDVYLGNSPELTETDLVAPHLVVTMYYHPLGLTPGNTYYWRVDEIEADSVTVHPGDVWSFTTQGLTAYLPSPADGASDALTAPTLTWLPAQGAMEHHLYLGENKDAVAEGAAETDQGVIEDTTFTPEALQDLTTYYWRVDETVPGGEVKTGSVWSFTTILPVDDFESYTDDEGSRIYETWIDGWTNNTGSVVGNLNAPFAEQKVVHGGAQSMPLEYNNVDTPYYSEAELDLASADWTAAGADTLVLYVRGTPGNAPGSLYVGIEDSSGQSATVAYPDTAVTGVSRWREWKIPLDSFAGVDLADAAKLFLGVGDKDNPVAGGAGRIYIDDIRVTASGAPTE